MRRATTWATVLGAAAIAGFGGCSPEAVPEVPEPVQGGPELPALELRPALPILRELAASGPQSPEQEHMRELRDLLETAYLPGYAPARSAAMAQRALGEEDDADWILEDALESHEDATIRAQCAFLLGDRGRVAAIPRLLMRVKYEKDAVVQVWVIGALAKLGCHGALDQLAALMDREDSAQRAGLVAIDVARAAGRDPGETPSYAALQATCLALADAWGDLGRVPAGDEAAASVPVLDDLDPLLRARLATHLIALAGEPLRPVDDCRFVFMRLGVLAVPMLDAVMTPEEPYVRNHVLEIVHALGRPAGSLGAKVLPILRDELTASLAARTLGSVGYGRALPFLLDRLDSSEVELRAAAAAGLGLLGDFEAYQPLLAHLLDVDEILDVRVEAAAAVARMDPGRRFLLERLAAGDYHEATILELLDVVGAERARRR